jgi:beta-glucosidase
MKMTRRDLLGKGSAAALALSLPTCAATPNPASAPAPAQTAKPAAGGFPPGFLWGAATAAHQVEGNNINTDLWLIERLPHSMFKEPSGDACDQYHLYEQDISLLADLGFNAYRFSIEWARIEPEEGAFSRAELEHYRRELQVCRDRGVTPVVTYYHVTMPRWLAYKGGWENPQSAEWFARYCDRATEHLGDLIGYAATFNEPDLPALFRWTIIPGPHGETTLSAFMRGQQSVIARQLGSPAFTSLLNGDVDKTRDNMIAAHKKGRAAIKARRSSLPVGLTLAMEDDQPVGPDSRYKEKQAEVYGPWLALAKDDDYIGVQTYTRSRIGQKTLPPPEGAEITQSSFEFYPEALENTVRFASRQAGVPVIVTENGVALKDDTRRVEYIQRALAGLKRCLDDGIDVRGYIHWSLLDNFEWISGFEPKFGLVAVDRETQRRTVKPSAVLLGNIARRNAL